jgi:hypothetical protein
MQRNQRDARSPAWQCGDLTIIAQRILAVNVEMTSMQRNQRDARSPHGNAGT